MEDKVVRHYNNLEEVLLYSERGLMKCEKEIFDQYIFEQDKVLDVGCYVGRVTFQLASKCALIVGIDISDVGIKEAVERMKSQKLQNCNFLVASVLDIPVESSYFEKVLMPYNTIESLSRRENRQKALAECSRVVQSSGLVIFSVHNRYYYRFYIVLAINNFFRLIFRLNAKFAKFILKKAKFFLPFLSDSLFRSGNNSVITSEANSENSFSYYYYSLKEIKEDLKQAGLKIDKYIPIGNMELSTHEGMAAQVLHRKNKLFVPGYYIIAKKYD